MNRQHSTESKQLVTTTTTPANRGASAGPVAKASTSNQASKKVTEAAATPAVMQDFDSDTPEILSSSP